VYILLYTAIIFVLLRLGLVMTVTTVFMFNFFNGITLGTDWTTWYAPAGFATITLLLVITLWAFRQALGDRELV
jgi:hypothetical protein